MKTASASRRQVQNSPTNSNPSRTLQTPLARRKEPKNDSAVSLTPSGGDTDQKETVFRFRAPSAQSVRLAADFTQWEKSPVEMQRSQDGLWQVSVPLPPGRYSYRFLVNGQWCDDPQCAEKETNSFGTTNAVINVA